MTPPFHDFSAFYDLPPLIRVSGSVLPPLADFNEHKVTLPPIDWVGYLDLGSAEVGRDRSVPRFVGYRPSTQSVDCLSFTRFIHRLPFIRLIHRFPCADS
jgi:hypothetical protein